MILKTLGNKNFLVLMSAVVVFLLTIQWHSQFEKPIVEISRQDSSINFNKDFLRIFSIGNKKLLSDLLWVQTLLQSDIEHYKKKDLDNWMFHRFMTIASLDPWFYENYFYGGMYLSIVKDDPLAASILYDEGLKIYPTNYALIYNAGFNYYFELQDYAKGLKLLDQIKDHPRAPMPLKSIVNKLKLATGADIDIVYSLVLERFNQTSEVVLKRKLREELYSIKAERDLKCLNQKQSVCDKIDFDGFQYIKDANGTFKTTRPFNLFRLTKKQKSAL